MWYDFILNQWILRKYDAAKVNYCVGRKYITQEQADAIMATPQIDV